jgi:hypothetical protein
MENSTNKLLKIIAEQCVILDEILAIQKRIREVVLAKDWAALEAALSYFDNLSTAFAAKEAERTLHSKFNMNKQVRDALALVRWKLTMSRIENAALNEYLKVTTNFLQGVFNSVAENRTSKVYSRTGSIVHAQPERLVLDALL